MHDNTENIREFAESLWQYFVPKIEQKMSNNVRYYRAQVVTNNGDGTLTIQRPYDNAITVPCVDSMKEAEVGAQVTVLVFGGTALKNSIVVADGKVSELGGGADEVEIGPEQPADTFKLWVDTNDTPGDDTVSIAGGGTGATTSAGARTNLVVAQKPKLLWSGSFSSGSITVPGYSDYELFAFESAAPEGLFLIGGYWAGVGGFTIYGSNYITVMGYRFGVDGDRLSIDSYNKGITSWDPTSGATATFAVTKIYGLVRKDDLQGE